MKKSNKDIFFSVIIILTGMVCIGYYIYINYVGVLKQKYFVSSQITDYSNVSQLYNVEKIAGDAIELTQDDIQIQNAERERYVDKDMVLEVDALSLKTKVLDGTGKTTLKKGVGLYEKSQLPSKKNSNVSIAGHRDVYGAEFYNIDKIKDGDKIILSFKEKKYIYDYLETKIIEKTDWKPIDRQNMSCVTLTSCHPINTSTNRIVVVAKLIEIWTKK